MRPRSTKVTNKELKKFRRILELQVDMRGGMKYDEAETKYDISRPTVASWKQMVIPDEVLSQLNQTEVEREIQIRNNARKNMQKDDPTFGMNQLDFLESSEGLGFKLFPRQRLIVKAFYGLALSVEEVAELEGLKAEGKTTWEPGQEYNELILEVGMKGGKTELIAALSCVEERELCEMDDFRAEFNLPAGKEVYIVNVAADKDQARDTIFAATQARIKHSKYYSKRNYKSGANTFEFLDSGIKMLSGHSNSSSLVGRTAKLVMIDEIARFVEKKTGKSSGRVVYNSLTRSIAPFKTQGRIVVLSSTMHEKDMINELYEMSARVPSMLGFKLATWEINPNLPFDCQFLQNELIKSPEDFWRDYGVQPARAIEKYIRDRIKIEKAFLLGRKVGLKNPMMKDGTFANWFKGNTEFNYFMHLDPAVNNCSFGIALAYKHGDVIRYPFIHGVKAKPNQEIDFKAIEEMLGIIIDRFPTLQKVSFDSYIAASLSQFVQSKGIDVEFLNIQKQHYDKFKIDGLYKEKVAMYENKVVKRELYELDLVKGKKVDHPDDGSKDESDAAAGAGWHAAHDEESVTDIAMGEIEPEEEVITRNSPMGLMFKRD